ncbi:MAG: hypothetical protein NVSMB4_02300 [Acidimicrobiales bacterium]
MSKLMALIPRALSSGLHLAFLVFLLGYIVIYAGAETFLFGNAEAVPVNTQLIAGNWTNVTSALGASIAAGMSVVGHQQRKNLRQQLADLHDKVDALL